MSRTISGSITLGITLVVNPTTITAAGVVASSAACTVVNGAADTDTL